MNQPPLNPDALKAALAWFAEAVREVEVKFADDGTRPGDYWTGYRAAKNEIADLLAEPKLIKKATRVAFAAALPEVTSVEELDQLPAETVVIDAHGFPYRRGHSFGNGHIGDWEGIEYGELLESDTIEYPARVFYRPEVKP